MKPTSNQVVNKSTVTGDTVTAALETLKNNSGATPSWDAVTGKPSTFPPSAHAHPEKQDTLVSGTNIQTVNGESILGSGNLVVAGGGGGGVTDHGLLTGLGDDDHTQYLNNTRGDARYSQLGHTHTASQISDSTATGRSVLTAATAADARTAIGAGVGDVTLGGGQSITGKVVYAFGSQVDAGNSGTTKTINFASGQKQLMTLTGNCTVTFSFPGVGNYQLILKQDATGNRTVTWSGVSLFVGSASAPAINTAANGFTIVSVFWDGSAAWLSAAKVNA